ncbi:hypothetical protein V1477_008817 [Vespula maculifrons]|uniref:Uncharacterized protein n=2 Tax=Vespula TaxID=7451 RepID=A0A834JUI1_VESGE|nr:hypothetical protein HZH68_010685 [Vespula germanica]
MQEGSEINRFHWRQIKNQTTEVYLGIQAEATRFDFDDSCGSYALTQRHLNKLSIALKAGLDDSRAAYATKREKRKKENGLTVLPPKSNLRAVGEEGKRDEKEGMGSKEEEACGERYHSWNVSV